MPDDMIDRLAEAIQEIWEDEPSEAEVELSYSAARNLLPLIAEVRAAGAAEVQERVEAVMDRMPHYSNWSYVMGYTNAIRAALGGDTDG